MAKKSFLIYTDSKDIFDELTDDEAGQLFKAFISYSITGIVPELDRGIKLLFLTFKKQFDRDNEKYDDTIERNKSNGNKGGRPVKKSVIVGCEQTQQNPNNPVGFDITQQNQVGYSETQPQKAKPKKPDSVKDSDKDSDSVKDSVCNTDVTKILSGIFVDRTPTHTLEEYLLVAKEFSQSRLLQKTFKTISLVDKHFDKIMAGAYRDFDKNEKQENSTIISNNFATDEVEKLNAMFDKMNEAL